MTLPLAAIVLYSIAAVGFLLLAFGVFSLWKLRTRRVVPATRHPTVSIIKPLCGLDDELIENLQSHLDQDYPGEWEVLLGVRSTEDAAYPVAKAFAEKNVGKVRLVLQDGEPGHNPKVNQLITLTRAAKFEVIAATDSNVRVASNYLRELVAVLEEPRCGLATHVFVGIREEKLGAVLDNLSLSFVCLPVLAAAVTLRSEELVGKSIAIRRDVLQSLGGWQIVKDVLAEDQRLGNALKENSLRAVFCPTPVFNVQRNQPFKSFMGRQARWAMIRYRVIFPMVLFEWVLNPGLLGMLALLTSPTNRGVWLVSGFLIVASAMLTTLSARILRGYGFRLKHLLLSPIRDIFYFVAWAKGATMRSVNWRGNELRVLKKTRLAEVEALHRMRNIQRVSR